MPAARWHDWAGLHAAVLLFGVAGLFGRVIDLPPLGIVLGRTAFAAAALLAVGAWAGPHARPAPAPAWGPAAGVVLAFHWVAFFQAIQVSSVAVGLVTFSSYPLFVTLFGWCGGDPLRRADVLAALGVAAGVILVVPDPDLGGRTAQGAVWGTLSGLSFAVLSLMNRRLVRDRPPVRLAAGQMLVATVVLAPLAVGTVPPPTLRDVMLLAVLGVGCTAVAHALFIHALAHVRPQTASVAAGLESVYGIAFAALLLGEWPDPRTAAGGAVIVGAVVVASGSCPLTPLHRIAFAPAAPAAAPPPSPPPPRAAMPPTARRSSPPAPRHSC